MNYLPAIASAGPLTLDTIHCVDALELMHAMPAQSVDAIITDLPYGTTACHWDTIIPFAPLWAAVKHCLKPRGVFITTASEPFASDLRVSNRDWYKYDWTWIKSQPGNCMNAKNKPMKGHEVVCVFSEGTTANGSDNRMAYYPQYLKFSNRNRTKGDNNPGKFGNSFKPYRPSHKPYIQQYTNYPTSVLFFEHETGYHPTQKPVALYEYLIRTYTQPGDLVLDPCCGSGTTALAARNTKRRYICGDTDAGYVETARLRLHGTGIDMLNAKEAAPLDELPLFKLAAGED